MSHSPSLHPVVAEQSVLGAMLLSAEAIDVASASLAEADFFRSDHRAIWRTMLELARTGVSCDAVTVGEWFQTNGLADLVGGGGYIVELANATPSAANVDAYAGIVRTASVRRHAAELCRCAAVEAETAGDVAVALSAHAQRVEALASGLSGGGLAPCRMPEPEEDLPSPDEVLPGLDSGTVGMLVGAGGVGKTMWSLQIAAGIATGKAVGLGEAGSWAVPQRGKVAMVCGEDPAWRISGRLQAIRRTMTAQDAEMFRAHASIHSGVAEDVRAVTHRYGEIEPGPFFSQVRALAQGRRLLILDPFAYLHDLSENDNSQMAQVVRLFGRIAAETGCAILLLHHSSAAGESARGATAIRYGARVGYVIRTPSEDEAAQVGVVCRSDWAVFQIVKENNGASRDAIWLRRGSGGVLQRALLPGSGAGDVAHISARGKASGEVARGFY